MHGKKKKSFGMEKSIMLMKLPSSKGAVSYTHLDVYKRQCKYCDYTRGVPYKDEPDFLVCGRCGAEWEDCKILVPDEQY